MPVETRAEYIRIRAKDPDTFDSKSLRTITISDKKGIKAIVGCPRGNFRGGRCQVGMEVQAHLFDKDKWTEARAKAWVKAHKRGKTKKELEAFQDLKIAEQIMVEQLNKPFAGFKNWNACIAAQKKRGYGEERASRICGFLKQKFEKADFKLEEEDYPIYSTLLQIEIPFKIEKRDKQDRIIAGYASVDLVDKQGERIPLETLKKAWEKFVANEDFAYFSILHSNIPVGKLLPEYTDSEGRTWKSGVDENGLFVISKIRDDIKVADRVWQLIENEQLKAFSLGGEALSKTPMCDDNVCPFKQIDDLEIHEIAIVDKGANQAAEFRVLKGASELLVGPVKRVDDLNPTQPAEIDDSAGVAENMASKSKTKGELNMTKENETKPEESEKEVEKEAEIPDANIEIKALLEKILDRLPKPVEHKEPEEEPKEVEKEEPEEKEEAKEPELPEKVAKWQEEISKKLGVPTPDEFEMTEEELIKELEEITKRKKKGLPPGLKAWIEEHRKPKKKEEEKEVKKDLTVAEMVEEEIKKRFGDVEPVKRSKVIKPEDVVEKSVEDLTLADFAKLSWSEVEKLANKYGSDL